VSRPALGPTQPPVQWVPGVLSTGVKARPGRDADHSSPSSVEVENEKEIYLLSPQAPQGRVAGLLYHLQCITDKHLYQAPFSFPKQCRKERVMRKLPSKKQFVSLYFWSTLCSRIQLHAYNKGQVRFQKYTAWKRK
jgi:hypothetical protein